MNYIYNCQKCKTEVEVVKPMSEVDKVEYCDKCGEQLKRNYKYSSAIFTADGSKY